MIKASFSKFIIIFIAVCILLIFLHYVGWLVPFENLIVKIFRPLQVKIFNGKIPGTNLFNQAQKIDELGIENEELKQEIDKLLVENMRLESILQESKILSQELEFFQERNLKFVPARVIGRSPEGEMETLIIDRGTKEGLQNDYPVIFGEGILVGKIIEAKENLAHVLLLTDSYSKVAASVKNDRNSPGVVVGKHGLSLELQLVPPNEEIQKDQYVVTSGLEENVPVGLLIGQIEKITTQAGDLFQTAILSLPASLERLQVVSVLFPEK